MIDPSTLPPETIIAPEPGTPEYEEAMAKVFDDSQTSEKDAATAGTKAERPANVPEKFWDAEKGAIKQDELLAAYAAAGKEPEAKTDEEGTPPATEVARQQAEAATALQEVGLAYDKYEAEYLATGAISDASYAEMAAKNISRGIVDAHISNLVKTSELESATIRASVLSTVGGEEKYSEMVGWAAKNVPQAELIAYNKITESGDIEQTKLAVSAMFRRYEANFGQAPNLLTALNGQGEATDVYRSTAQMTAEMADPRYNRDPAFRAYVEAKLARSNIM